MHASNPKVIFCLRPGRLTASEKKYNKDGHSLVKRLAIQFSRSMSLEYKETFMCQNAELA